MRFVLMLIVALPLSACAFTNVQVDLPEGIGTGVHGGNGRMIYVNIPFSDMRPDKTRCGMQKNGFNMDTASVICSEEPASWIARMLERELRMAGFEVLGGSSERVATAVGVDGALLQLFIEPVVWSRGEVETDIHVKLALQSNTGFKAERNFYVKGSLPVMDFSSGIFQASVIDATSHILVQMIDAIISIMNRYPQLGLIDEQRTDSFLYTRGEGNW